MRWPLKPTSTLAAITSANPSQRLLRPAPVPAIEMAGFDSSFPARLPVIEMAGFGNRKYRPTVSRLIPNSFAIRRRDHPRWAKLYIVVCRLTLRTFDMPHRTDFFPAQRSCFVFLKVAGFESLNFDYYWLVLTDR